MIPGNVTSIGERAFAGCKGLTSILVSSSNSHYKSKGNCCIDRRFSTLIFGCSESIIPDSVSEIGEAAFAWCDGLIGINIPNSVSYIGKNAFRILYL